MQLTTFTDYCLRVLLYVAAQPERRATISEIAHSYGISEHHLTKVVHLLGKAGLLLNVRGHGGGITLARPAERIGVGDVVRLAEGEPQLAACFDAAAPRCVIAPACRLKGVLKEAADAFYAALDGHTVADLVAQPGALRTILLSPRSNSARPPSAANKRGLRPRAISKRP